MVTNLPKGGCRWFFVRTYMDEGDTTGEAQSEDDKITIMWTDVKMVVRSLVLKPVT